MKKVILNFPTNRDNFIEVRDCEESYRYCLEKGTSKYISGNP